MRALVIAISILLPLVASAQRIDDARARFEEGQRLYEAGKFEDAIAAFEAAYKAKPHPNVLYNIGQAYERLLDYPSSVRFFERYLAETAPTAEFRNIVENRLRVLHNLPGRVSVVTFPEKVTATFVAQDKSKASVEESGVTPKVFRLAPGDYTLRLEAAGLETEEHEIHVEIGQPYFYQYRLKRLTVQVTLFSKPQRARVFIDNRMVGETPWAGEVEVGKHQLLLEHPDYPWHKEELVLAARQPLKKEIRFSRPVRSGRTELIIGSMIYGGVAAPLLVTALVPPSSSFIQTPGGLATMILSSAAGLGAGFLGAFLTTKDGVGVGTSSLALGGAAWGGTVGFTLGLSLNLDRRYTIALGILGSGVGLTSGLLVAKYRKVSAGDAAIVNSSGIWGTVGGLMMAQAIFREPTAQQLGLFTIGTTSASLIIGSVLAWKLERSRGHVALVDSGALIGGGLGFAVGYAVGATSRDNNGLQEGARYGLGGMALGLLAAAVLASTYRADAPPTEALLLHHDGKWKLGLPRLSIDATQVSFNKWEPKVSLSLASGTF